MTFSLQWIIAFLLIPVVYRESAAQTSLLNVDERKALIALYENTGGNAWVRRDGWLGTIGTECGWYGVGCVRDLSENMSVRYTVRDLDLRRNGLTGQIPPEVGALKNLKHLMLQGNAVKGPLPDVLLQKFDQAQLDIEPLSLIHDVEEVLVEVDASALLCADFRAWISADGIVRRERKVCRKRNGRQTLEVYYEYQQGKTYDFDRLARCLIRGDYFSDTKSSVLPLWYWFDVADFTVTARRSGGLSMRRSWSRSPSLWEWNLEMIQNGLIARVEWVGKPTTKTEPRK
jgi:hypothetical protein